MIVMSEQKTQIKKLWRIIGTNSSSVLELRAIWPSGIQPIRPPLTVHFRASDFADI